MIKSIEDVSATKKRLKIEIPAEAFEAKIKDGLQTLRAKTRMPGFRPGKAPIALIERRFGKEVESEALEKTVNEVYSKAVREAALRPVAAPVFEEAGEFKRNNPLSMTILVEVSPKFDNLSYDGVKVKDIPVSVEDADIDNTLKRLQEDKAVFEPSEDPVKQGDLAIMDYETKEDGKSYKEQAFKVGSELMPEEFSQKLIGMKKAEEKEFEIVFPEGFHIKDVAGKKVTFKVTLKDVKSVDLPAIDDEFAKDLGLETLAALRENIGQRLLKSKENAVRNILKAEVTKKLLEANDFEAPESLVKAEIERLVATSKTQGRKEPDEELQKALGPGAVRNVKASLLIQAIGEKEKITVAENELKEKIQSLSEGMSLTPENIIKYYVARDGSLEGLQHQIFEEKVLELLLSRAEIEKGE